MSMIIVATELHVRSFWKFFPFARHASRSMKQAKRSPGIIHAYSTNSGWRIGFTLTAWENKETMMQFRNTGAHKEAMKQISRLSHQYKTLVWEADAVPNWKDAKKKLDKADLKILK
ncbi:MAG TPA: DUF3291 domain-containing protein [Chitinophagaceae bacterium]|nr:DUF3291 domain-containing protein [Chitinophagaceae bacterium]HRX93401.1 DUF3291 domain-containing protein [Chitinophagaceae bacterium]